MESQRVGHNLATEQQVKRNDSCNGREGIYLSYFKHYILNIKPNTWSNILSREFQIANKLMTLNTKEKYQLYFLLNTKCLCYILSKILANLALNTCHVTVNIIMKNCSITFF